MGTCFEAATELPMPDGKGVFCLWCADNPSRKPLYARLRWAADATYGARVYTANTPQELADLITNKA